MMLSEYQVSLDVFVVGFWYCSTKKKPSLPIFLMLLVPFFSLSLALSLSYEMFSLKSFKSMFFVKETSVHDVGE